MHDSRHIIMLLKSALQILMLMSSAFKRWRPADADANAHTHPISCAHAHKDTDTHTDSSVASSQPSTAYQTYSKHVGTSYMIHTKVTTRI